MYLLVVTCLPLFRLVSLFIPYSGTFEMLKKSQDIWQTDNLL
jgi:hypothetical protein